MNATPALAFAAVVVFAVAFLVERALLRWRWTPYFTLGFPLVPPLLPIPEPPQGQGRAGSVRWERVDDELVRWWADPKSRGAPFGLHGSVHLDKVRRGPNGHEVHLTLRWAPSWTPLLAAAWLAGVGLTRGEGFVSVPIASALVLLVLYVNRQAAVRVAAELRWCWLQ